MKSKSISFAQVLKKKVRSPQLDKTAKKMRLLDLVQEFEQNPNQDYTLYLGNFSLSHKSKQSTIHMHTSKNAVNNQEEMFDSWIQRQSFVSHNKENISNQPRKSQNQLIKNQKEPLKNQNINAPQHENIKNPPKRMADIVRQPQSKQYSNMMHPNIEMIRSNYSDQEQVMQNIKSPKNKFKNIEEVNLEFDQPEYMKMKPETNKFNNEPANFKVFKEKNNLRKEMDKITTDKMEEMTNIIKPSNNYIQMPTNNAFTGNKSPINQKMDKKQNNYPMNNEKPSFNMMNNKPFSKMLTSNQQTQNYMQDSNQINNVKYLQINRREPSQPEDQVGQLLASTEHIHHDISDIARKYLEQNDDEDEQLLIDNSNKKDDNMKNHESQYFYNEVYKEKAKEQQQLQKKRLQEAKALLGTYVKNITKGKDHKEEKNEFKPMNYYISDNKLDKEDKYEEKKADLQVGYSFSSNLLEDTPNNDYNTMMSFAQKYQLPQGQNAIQNIPEIRSEMPSIAHNYEQEGDMQFKKKYLNFQSISDPTEIQKIKSINYQENQKNGYEYKYEHEYERQNMANSSMDEQFINSSYEKENEPAKESFARQASQKELSMKFSQNNHDLYYQGQQKEENSPPYEVKRFQNEKIQEKHHFINPFEKQSSITSLQKVDPKEMSYEYIAQKPLQKSKDSDTKMQRKPSNQKLTVFSSKIKVSPQNIKQSSLQSTEIKVTDFITPNAAITTKTQSINNSFHRQQKIFQEKAKVNTYDTNNNSLKNSYGFNFLESMSKDALTNQTQAKFTGNGVQSRQSSHVPFSTQLNLRELKEEPRKYSHYAQKYAIPAPITISNYENQQKIVLKVQTYTNLHEPTYTASNKLNIYSVPQSTTSNVTKQFQSKAMIKPAFDIKNSVKESNEFQFDF